MGDTSNYTRLRERLEEIVTQVRSKDLPLEKSLDLYEEALRLGSRCAEAIDRTDFSAEELEGLASGGHAAAAGVALGTAVSADEGDEELSDDAFVIQTEDGDSPHNLYVSV
ncbi:MAG: exodeoxyribonuclease VII small subunit [Coriobacteriales bacterium]|jgi:exodeoxyribonuclease VII small subunit|nr:exodeoxyribonuclease VII small subunit [Coriobacteriales bacterium]